MQTKKLLSLGITATALVFLAGCGTTTTTTTTTTTPTPTTTVTTSKDASKAECLELMAYAFKAAQLQALGETDTISTWVNKAGDLELKYRAEGKEYENACNKYLANTKDLTFFNEVQARVKELK